MEGHEYIYNSCTSMPNIAFEATNNVFIINKYPYVENSPTH
ncbi:hypothetical protein RG47T_2650 [Mucilaginibacter polytrichastri]|uniref:Uncharacterized protein n=1 Tax=Mucilaginibacter polytrichastri TaxID=1302689 RepID=A0A1Q5ZZL6_9SPHI|nr:hypothetical protein RG47T_2650 [Mucilaginibacter polytrichastri]